MIETKEMHFGEGIDNWGTADAQKAFEKYRAAVRIKRLNDMFGSGSERDAKMSYTYIEDNIDKINAAFRAADNQVILDNKAWIEKYNVVIGR